MKKITRNNINKGNMVALSYCQCQSVLNRFAYEFKVGYNTGCNGWNYDLYRIGNYDIVTGYNVPYRQYSDIEKKKKLIALENKLKTMGFAEFCEKRAKLKKEFLNIFE